MTSASNASFINLRYTLCRVSMCRCILSVAISHYTREQPQVWKVTSTKSGMDKMAVKRWTKISLRTLHLLTIVGVAGGHHHYFRCYLTCPRKAQVLFAISPAGYHFRQRLKGVAPMSAAGLLLDHLDLLKSLDRWQISIFTIQLTRDFAVN